MSLCKHLYCRSFFYEDKSFWGCCYECSSDHLDLQSYVKQCNSIQVEKGSWMVSEKPNYSGHQYFLKRGDYSDFQKWLSLCDSISSRNAPHARASHSSTVCHMELQGQMLEFTDNCPSVPGYIHLPEICSLNVLGGSWILYEMEYRRVLDCGAVNAKIVSLQRMTDLH
uniref:Beta/gamma crystallin 'Greek key' domain-containing protein n=1 Tax=Buteo japonicus TaxID=224669 RepID=A0A8C0BKH1_9AVES